MIDLNGKTLMDSLIELAEAGEKRTDPIETLTDYVRSLEKRLDDLESSHEDLKRTLLIERQGLKNDKSSRN